MPHFTYVNNARRCNISNKSKRVPVGLTVAQVVDDYQVRVVHGQGGGGGHGDGEKEGQRYPVSLKKSFS